LSSTESNNQPVIILAAVRDEINQIVDRFSLMEMGDEYIGQIAGQRVIAAVSGIGHQRAVDLLGKMIDKHEPSLILNVGFAGGLDPTLAAGDVMRVRHVISEQKSVLHLGEAVPESVPDTEGRPTVHTLLTLDRVVDSPQGKSEMFERFNAAAVDMETFYTASLAMERRISFQAIRAISDPSDIALPAAAMDWVGSDGSPDMAKVMTYVATHPWVTPTLMKLQGYASMAATRLAEALQAVLEKASADPTPED